MSSKTASPGGPTISEYLTPEKYLRSLGDKGFSRWPALPFWGLVESLDAEIRKKASKRHFVPVRDAYLSSFVDAIAEIAYPALTSDLMAEGEDVHEDERLWRRLEGNDSKSLPPGRHTRLQPRIEALKDIYLQAALALQDRLSRSESSSWGTLTGLQLMGDMHARGAVALLYYDGEPKVVYKPRSLAVDVLFNSILESLRTRVPNDVLPGHPWSIDCEHYGFQEYLPYGSPGSEIEYSSFYKKYGALVAFSYLFSIDDLHYENVISTATGPAVLDLECMFRFPLYSDSRGVATNPLFTRPLSVIDSMLVPNWKINFDAAGPVETTALGRYAHIDRNPPKRVLSFSDGAPTYSYERSTTADAVLNHPWLSNETIPTQRYRREIISGFRQVYRAFLDSSVRHDTLQLIEESRTATVRIVLNDTTTYVTYIQAVERQSPEYDGSSSTHQSWVRAQEEATLDQGVVPVFQQDIGTGTLIADDGSTFVGFRAPIEQVARRMRLLSEKELEQQTHGLEMSLSLGSYNPADGPAHAVSLPYTSDLSNTIGDTVSRIISQIRETDGTPWAYFSSELQPGYWTLGVTPPNLYSGLPGVAFALGIAGRIDANAQEAYAALRDKYLVMIHDYLSSVRDQEEPLPMTMTGPGPLGVIFSLASVAYRVGDVGLLHDIGELGPEIERHAPAFGKTDLIGGTSGAVVVLGTLWEFTGHEAYLRMQAACLDDLTRLLPEKLKANAGIDVGIAHGLSGVSVALASAAKLSTGTSEALADAARNCLSLEDDQAELIGHGSRERSWSWCWGAAGQLEARLFADYQSSREESLREKLWESGDSRFQSICHGSLGVNFLMRTSAYQSRYGSRDARIHTGDVLARIREYPSHYWGSPDFAPDIGLYNGLSGLLLFLCSVKDGAALSIFDLRYGT